MNITEILAAIDGEIARLTQARSLLGGLNTTGSSAERVSLGTAPRRGRPGGSKNEATSFNPRGFDLPKRRAMSPEGKARIAAAQRARWARKHGADATRPASKSSAASKPARANAPAEELSKALPATKRTIPVKEAGASASAAGKSNPVKKAPGKSVVRGKTAIASKTASEITAGQTVGAKTIASKKAGRKAATPRTTIKQKDLSSKAVAQPENPTVAPTGSGSSAK